jgi:hypothetical protein
MRKAEGTSNIDQGAKEAANDRTGSRAATVHDRKRSGPHHHGSGTHSRGEPGRD